MNHHDNDTQDFDEVIEPEIAVIAPRKPSFLGAFLGRTGGTLAEDIRADAEIAYFRTQLSEFTLMRVGNLSAMEQQLSTMTPQAAERLQAIVDAYTRQSLKQLERW